MKARRQYNNIFKVLKEKDCPPKILYPAKLSFKIRDEIKTLKNKQNKKNAKGRT